MVGGRLLGGAQPSIADLLLVSRLAPARARCPGSFLFREPLVGQYLDAALAALPRSSEYLRPARSFFAPPA